MELLLMSFSPEEWGKQSSTNLLILHLVVLAILTVVVLLFATRTGRSMVEWCFFRVLDALEWCTLQVYQAAKWIRSKF